ncbi:MAG TPA: secondary thiamine-phosphate synthase enzyme YjbQ [Steroidobacteraceae bacterium]|jgi:secondary thiamine-phosphate synthase enzyme
MRQFVTTLSIQTQGAGLYEITDRVRAWCQSQGVGKGLLTLFCRHTSASLLIQENAAPAVRDDLRRFFAGLVPEEPGRYAHDDEGPDDMPAHIKAALTQIQFSIPLIEAELALGTWQGIYVFEHRIRAHTRSIALHLLGE